MPTLKRYVESSDKAGFYILSNVGGTNPVTIQVSPLGETILQKADYQPEDNIPSKLVWSMYDVGLAYTSGSVADRYHQDQDDVSLEQFVTVANKLTSRERQRLLELLREYNGSGEAQVRELITKIETEKNTSSGQSNNSSDDRTTAGRIGADVDSIDSVLDGDS